MIGIDTNILIRHIRQDEPVQSPAASRLLGSLTESDTGFVPLVVVIELNLVFASGYNLDRGQIVQAFDTVLGSRELVVEGAETVCKALHVFARSKADFAVCHLTSFATVRSQDRIGESRWAIRLVFGAAPDHEGAQYPAGVLKVSGRVSDPRGTIRTTWRGPFRRIF